MARLLQPWVDEEIVTNAEANIVNRNLRSLAKSGTLVPAYPPKLLTASEVAGLLGISLSTFRHAEIAGDIAIPRKIVGRGAVCYLNLEGFAYMADSCDTVCNIRPPVLDEPRQTTNFIR